MCAEKGAAPFHALRAALTVALFWLLSLPFGFAQSPSTPRPPPRRPLAGPPGFQRTRSETLPPPVAGACLRRAAFSSLEFTKPGLFPVTSLFFELSNDSFVPSRAGCRETLLAGGFVGQPSLLPLLTSPGIVGRNAAGVEAGTRQGDVDVFGVPPVLSPAFVDGSTVVVASAAGRRPPTFSTLEVRIFGSRAFALPDSAGTVVSFEVQIPAVCVARGAAPRVVGFNVTVGARSRLGRLMTFLHFLASSFALVNAVAGGSGAALSLLQGAALWNTCGCLPIPIQEEGELQLFTVVPVVSTALPAVADRASVGRDAFLLSVAVGIAAGVWLLELAHKAVRVAWAAPPPPEHDAASNHSDNASEHPAHPDHGTKTTAGNDSSGKSDALTEAGSTSAAAAADNDGNDVTTLQPGFLGLAVHLSLLPGILRFSLRAATAVDGGPRWAQVLGIIILAPHALAPLIAALHVARTRALFFVPYPSAKGRISTWLQPRGTWAPNDTRLTFGAMFEDWGRGRRVFGLCFGAWRLVVSLLSASTPGSADHCRAALLGASAVTALLAAAVWRWRPMRARLSTIGAGVGAAALALYWLLLGIHAGFREDAATRGVGACRAGGDASDGLGGDSHWLLGVAFGVGAAFGLVMALSASAQTVGLVWEAHNGRAVRNARDNAQALRAPALEAARAARRGEDGGTGRAAAAAAVAAAVEAKAAQMVAEMRTLASRQRQMSRSEGGGPTGRGGGAGAVDAGVAAGGDRGPEGGRLFLPTADHSAASAGVRFFTEGGDVRVAALGADEIAVAVGADGAFRLGPPLPTTAGGGGGGGGTQPSSQGQGRQPPPSGAAASLADYLLQDYDMLPAATKDEFASAMEGHRRRQAASQPAWGPTAVGPGVLPPARNNPYYREPRADRLPIHLATSSLL